MHKSLVQPSLVLDDLEEAAKQPGCQVCWEIGHSSRKYFRALLREHRANEGVWESLQRTWGLCRQHTRALLAAEGETVRDFSTATLYRWLGEVLLAKAGWGESETYHLSPRRLRALLRPEGACLACEELGEYQRAVVGSLVRALASGAPSALVDTYFRGDGLCLPHLRLALGLTEYGDTIDQLAAHFLSRIQRLTTELEAFLKAFAQDGLLGEKSQSDVWRRAAERFAGRLGISEDFLE
jgi:hypothetical protein